MIDVELIIFDLDGTLVNSQYDLADAVNHALANMNRRLITYDEVPAMIGSGVTRLLELALGEYTDNELHIARHYFDAFYRDNFSRKTKYYAGVSETLEYFKHKKKAVYSNKVHAYTVEIIRELKLDSHFDIVMGSAPQNYAPKPSPEGIQIILSKLDIPPHKAIMVGDSTHDIHAAQEAGIHSCAVAYGYRPLSLLRKMNPTIEIDMIEDIKNYIV